MPTPTHAEISVKVLRKVEIVPRVMELTLQPVAGTVLPEWQPGAHIDLVLPGELIRQYSLCGDPKQNDRWRIAVLQELEGRGGSEYIHTELDEGTTIAVMGPRNHFPLEPADEYLFVGGGIGITPLLPMIQAVASGDKPWRLVYGGRSRAGMPYLEELEATFPQNVKSYPQDQVGLLDLQSILGEESPGRAVYACGPAPMLLAIQAHCAGWSSGSVHMETFAALGPTSSTSDGAFEVTVASSNETHTVAADQTILDVLRAANADVDWSCEEGTCGTCETKVLEGVPDHRDFVLTDDEKASNEIMIICTSRAKSAKLVLDL